MIIWMEHVIYYTLADYSQSFECHSFVITMFFFISPNGAEHSARPTTFPKKSAMEAINAAKALNYTIFLNAINTHNELQYIQFETLFLLCRCCCCWYIYWMLVWKLVFHMFAIAVLIEHLTTNSMGFHEFSRRFSEFIYVASINLMGNR